MHFHMLHPDAGTLDATEIPAWLNFAARAPEDRPHVAINMIASVDGRATVDGRSEGLGGPADKAMFFALRASVDAVLAGTGTLAAEQYGRLIKKPERRAQRVGLGLEPEPVALVLSRSGDLPDIPLLSDPEARPLLLTGDEAEPRRALRTAREEHGVRTVLCEGGPNLNGALLDAGVVDELFLTVSPLIVGGKDPLTIVEGGADRVDAALVSVLEADGMLFLRYAVSNAGRGAG